MIMGIGLGVGINRSNYAQGIFGAYATRVVADGGVVEGGTCVDAVSGLLLNASLLLIPSGYKGGKLYSQIPTNGNGDLTWTRGSDAFRTNASGLIQRVPWNLLGYSETFSDAYWNKITSTITANTTIAPNGTLTADTLNVTAVTYSGLGRAITGVSANYNVSIYAKKNTKNWLYLIDVQGTSSRAWFDLDNGVLGTVASGYTATITNVGDGWYRCTLSNNNAQTLAYYQLGLADANNGITPTSSGSAFIWGAQLVEGTTAQTYLPTTDRLNFPRLSYMYGSCPAVLLEPQRTNLAVQSQDFDNVSWGKVNSSVTANNTTAPNGTNTADLIIENSANSTHLLTRPSLSLSSGAYSITVYAKAKERSKLMIFYAGTIAKGYGFDLANGTTSAVTGVTPADSFAITSVGNGWYRCQIGINSSTLTQLEFYLLNSFTSYIYTGDGTSGLYLWGAQLEAGAYPTTYIPTTTATATRVADSAVKTGISSLIGQTEGTIFVDFIVSGIGANNINIYNNDRTPSTISTNAIVFKPNGNIECQTFLGNGTFNTISITASTYTVGQRIKLAYRYKSGDFALYINGIQKATATNTLTFVGTKSQIYLDDNAVIYGYQEAVHYNQFALFTTALTNAELTQLTT